MPFYVYKCSSCGHVVELLQKVSEAEAPASCEACDAPHQLEKQVTAAAGFKFKGTGFYATDFKHK
jgi:putative FmdB family regulatory protein